MLGEWLGINRQTASTATHVGITEALWSQVVGIT